MCPPTLTPGALGARHLDGGVPADPAAVFALRGFVAGEVRFLVNGDGVDVGGRVFLGELHAVAARFVQHVQQDVARAGAALFVDEPGQGLDPFGGLLGVVSGTWGISPLTTTGRDSWSWLTVYLLA